MEKPIRAVGVTSRDADLIHLKDTKSFLKKIKIKMCIHKEQLNERQLDDFSLLYNIILQYISLHFSLSVL